MSPARTKTGGGSIERLEVENFKSYKGRQTIGPFRNFTAVIGPNGAGKSNLMDAISFVLGVRSATLRGAQLKDLIYAVEVDPSQRRKASVKLVYLTEDGEELHFYRGISAAGVSDYKINDRAVSWDAYNDKLKSLGILVKARNFLVFQGDVESIASKSPLELTAFIEKISGSDELKKDYEQLAEEKKAAESRVAFSFQKKKGIAGERKQRKKQKEEAEHHMELEEQMVSAKKQLFLWRLYHARKDMEGLSRSISSLNDELADVARAHMRVEESVKERKKAKAKWDKEALKLEARLEAKRTEHQKKEHEAVAHREAAERHRARQQRLKSELKSLAKQRANQEAAVAKLQEDLDAVLAAEEEAARADAADAAATGGITLGDAQLSEYNEKKTEAGTKTVKLRSEKDALERRLTVDRETLKSLELKLGDVEREMARVEQEVTKAEEREAAVKASIADSQAKLEALRAADANLHEEAQKKWAREAQLRARIGEIDGQLGEAKAMQRESQSAQRTREAVASMKGMYKGVHGRMVDLVKPLHPKYNLAVTVVMGAQMDNIVVDDQATAKECMQYLKDMRMPPMTFVPLATIRTKPLNERLRLLGGTAKPMMDVLGYDASLEKAVLFACGNTVVCDTLDEARQLAHGAERRKVVSLDGTLFSASGKITGGISAHHEAKAARWEEQAVNELRTNLERYERELASLGETRDVASEKSRVAADISGLTESIKFAELDVAKAAALSKERTVATLQGRIHEVEDRIFAEFSGRVGVSSIREFEENALRQRQKVAEARMAFKQQIARLRGQHGYESQRLKSLADQVAKAQASLDKEAGEAQALAAADVEAKSWLENSNEELEKLQAELKEHKGRASEVEAEVKEAAALVAKHVAEASKRKKAIAAQEAKLDTLKMKVSEILATAEMEQVSLPVAGQEASLEVNTAETGASDTAWDFAQLDERQRKHPLEEGEAAAMEGELQRKVEALAGELSRGAPNMKAVEQYEGLKQRERELGDDFDRAKEEARAATEKFNAVKIERHRRFSEAFQHIQGVIEGIYRELTRSAAHPLGGQAYLDADNMDEPYLAGLKFTAMPPTKRFRDMEQLSGGEKTVAALALLFAIHSFRPSPFFVLDEVDAALDNVNVAKVAAYIQHKTRAAHGGEGERGGFQSVVISLKDNFYDKADSLVGVYRDCDANCSKTLTFSLEPYKA
eukprot:jgi/Mesvir1/8992/Mv25967-RA.2